MNDMNEEKEAVVNTVDKFGDECCRVCLKKSNQLWQLFRQTGGDDEYDDIPRKLMAFAAVKVEEGDGLPTSICMVCRKLLDVSYGFKCQVENADSELRQILIPRADGRVKILSLDYCCVDATAFTKPMASDAMYQERLTSSPAAGDVGERTESTNADDPIVMTTATTTLNAHDFTVHHEPIIFEIQPPSVEQEQDQERSLLRPDEKHTAMLNRRENRHVDASIAEYNDQQLLLLEKAYTGTERLADESAMDINDEDNDDDDESEITEDENTECLVENKASAPDNLNIETMPILERKESKNQVCESDDEAEEAATKPLSIGRRHRCTSCIKTFATKSALERHQEIHKTKLRYVCYMCDKQFATISKLKGHVLSSHDSLKRSEEKQQQQRATESDASNLKHVCKICGKQFTYRKSFMSHTKTHDQGYKPADTAANDEEYDDEDGSLNEKEKHVVPSSSDEDSNESDDDEEEMPVEGLQCTQCGKLFATKRNLKRHILTHSGLKFHCSTCGKEFSRIDKLKEHERDKHNEELFASSDSAAAAAIADTEDDDDDDTDNENKNHKGSGRRKVTTTTTRPHQCHSCPKAFAQEQSLTNHMERHKRVKDTQKRFLCEVCSKCFAQSGSLVAHMRTHTGVKPYVCNVCSRAFTKSTYLQLHLRTHSGEKPYICQYCSRAFARANTLARHITMHTGEAKYHCQICGKSFRRLTSLNEHTYTHTGQRPYACKICTKRYNNAGSLYAHTKKCKAQQLSGVTTATTTGTGTATTATYDDASTPPMTIYSQRKLVVEDTATAATSSTQFMNVHNPSLKSLPPNDAPMLPQQFTPVEDPNFCTVNKPYKNPYYAIYP